MTYIQITYKDATNATHTRYIPTDPAETGAPPPVEIVSCRLWEREPEIVTSGEFLRRAG